MTGAHVYCDKPLATNPAQARRLFDVVERAGVKHAYAVTHHYDPSVRWLAGLVRDGTIGTLREVEGTFRRYLPPLTRRLPGRRGPPPPLPRAVHRGRGGSPARPIPTRLRPVVGAA